MGEAYYSRIRREERNASTNAEVTLGLCALLFGSLAYATSNMPLIPALSHPERNLGAYSAVMANYNTNSRRCSDITLNGPEAQQ